MKYSKEYIKCTCFSMNLIFLISIVFKINLKTFHLPLELAEKLNHKFQWLRNNNNNKMVLSQCYPFSQQFDNISIQTILSKVYCTCIVLNFP